MNIIEKVRWLREISISDYIYYNYISKNVIHKGRGRLVPFRHSVIEMGNNSKIILHDGDFYINNNKPKHSKAEAYVKLQEEARLEIFKSTYLNYLATIEVQKNAFISIGSAYINTGAVILAAKKIKLGKDQLISRNVFIYDSDHHTILNPEGEQTNPAKEVIIGNHVWIGAKCTILRGAKIGKGAMIAANSVVGGKIKPGTMASGNPARSYSEINWRN